MFKKDISLSKRCSALDVALSDARAELAKLKEIPDDHVVIDYSQVDVVSVERYLRDGRWITEVSYMRNDVMHSMIFITTDVEHARIVSEFRQYIRTREYDEEDVQTS